LIEYLIARLGKKTAGCMIIPDQRGLAGLTPLKKFMTQLEKMGIAWSLCGGGFASRCPAHMGRRENLNFREAEDGRLLVHCKRDCGFEEVLEAVNLTTWNAYYYPPSSGTATTGPFASNVDAEDELGDEQRAKLQYMYERACKALAARPEKLHELADRLGVSTEALEQIGVGWREDRTLVHGEWVGTGDWAWIFPEVNGDEEIVGLLRRYERPGKDKDKKLIAGGRRGLIVPNRWKKGEGPLYIVEGASDVAAMLTLQFTAIGRPQAVSRRILRDLVELLRADARLLVVIADSDEVGRTGARSLASSLNRRLGREVRIAEPPRGCKDMREYLNSLGNLN
jgi:hypothetical protein